MHLAKEPLIARNFRRLKRAEKQLEMFSVIHCPQHAKLVCRLWCDGCLGAAQAICPWGWPAGDSRGRNRQGTKKPAFAPGHSVEMRRPITGGNEDGFRDGFCRANPLMSWHMDGKVVKIISGGQTGAGPAALRARDFWGLEIGSS